MTQLHRLLPALGASPGDSPFNAYWWLMLAVAVVAIVLPVAYLVARDGGHPLHR